MGTRRKIQVPSFEVMPEEMSIIPSDGTNIYVADKISSAFNFGKLFSSGHDGNSSGRPISPNSQNRQKQNVKASSEMMKVLNSLFNPYNKTYQKYLRYLSILIYPD